MKVAAVLAGIQSGRSRLPPAKLAAATLVAISLGAGSALLSRRSSPQGAATAVLADVVFGLAVPLLAWYVCGQALDRSRLDTAASAAARFGGSRREVGLGLVVASVVPVVVASVLAGVIALLLAHDVTAPPRFFDALTVAWIAALSSAAYLGVLALGSTFGLRGGGRLVLLAADFLVGDSGASSSLVLPRGHVMNLIGSATAPTVSQALSVWCLVGIAVASSGLALVRCKP